jgi:putative drug exporter of the RND superfamily
MTGVLYGLAQFCVRRRYYVLIAWLIITVALVVVSHRLGDNTNDNLSLPGTDSQRATNVLAKSFPDQSNGSSPIVIHAASGQLTDAKNKQAVEAAAADVAKEPHVASVVSPLTPQGAAALSKDQATGYLSVTLSVSPGSLSREDAQKIIDGANPAKEAGLEVEIGGQLGQKVSKPATESSELIGIIAAMVILTLTFGTVVSMLLPILNAIFGLLATLAIIRILGHAATVPTVAPTLATMIGLGVGIDYALFILTRHQAQRRAGMATPESIARAAATSGGAVVFAGTTVIVALLSLAVVNIPLVTTLGYTSALVVAIVAAASITLLPAILGLVGDRIDRLALPHRRTAHDGHPHGWERWARLVARRPLPSMLVAVVVLGVLALPALDLYLGQQDNGALPKSTDARQAYDG